MSRYILIRRLRGPAFLLLVGVNALLAQAHILGWGKSWPFYLILAGLFALAERAAIETEGYPPYQGAPNQGAPWPGTSQAPNQGAPYQGSVNTSATTSTALVPSPRFENDLDGGQQ